MQSLLFNTSPLFGVILFRIGFIAENIANRIYLCSSYIKEEHEQRKLSFFNEIITLHDNLISRLCMGYASTASEFEDLRQDTYVNIWQGLNNFRGDSSIKTWLYRVTLNTCVSTLRSRAKRNSVKYIDEIYSVNSIDIADENSDFKERVEALYKAIHRLSSIDKAIVMLWLDSLSYEEIATTMGLNKNTIATRLHRAKNKLYQYITED